MDGKRILAVQLDDELFNKLDEYVKDANTTKLRYVSELIKNDLEQKLQEKQKQEVEVEQTDAQKVWDKAEVINAIDEFMKSTGRIPKQTEFKNENGLPSYGAAGRALDGSPAEYMKVRYEDLVREQNMENEMDMRM